MIVINEFSTVILFLPYTSLSNNMSRLLYIGHLTLFSKHIIHFIIQLFSVILIRPMYTNSVPYLSFKFLELWENNVLFSINFLFSKFATVHTIILLHLESDSLRELTALFVLHMRDTKYF